MSSFTLPSQSKTSHNVTYYNSSPQKKEKLIEKSVIDRLGIISFLEFVEIDRVVVESVGDVVGAAPVDKVEVGDVTFGSDELVHGNA